MKKIALFLALILIGCTTEKPQFYLYHSITDGQEYLSILSIDGHLITSKGCLTITYGDRMELIKYEGIKSVIDLPMNYGRAKKIELEGVERGLAGKAWKIPKGAVVAYVYSENYSPCKHL